MDKGWTVNGQLQKALKTTLANYSEKTKKNPDRRRTSIGQRADNFFYQTD
ncbi:TPA_asm: hypothetical protein GYT64_15590 [Listeria monocytogenes]|nr:hypothetical protein [Listeria monocytogenes]